LRFRGRELLDGAELLARLGELAFTGELASELRADVARIRMLGEEVLVVRDEVLRRGLAQHLRE
jgi:hypothetical protein